MFLTGAGGCTRTVGCKKLHGGLLRTNGLNLPLFVIDVAVIQKLQDVNKSTRPDVCASPDRGVMELGNEI